MPYLIVFLWVEILNLRLLTIAATLFSLLQYVHNGIWSAVYCQFDHDSNDQQATECELSARPAVSTLSVLARGLMRMRKRYITCIRPRELVRVVSVEEVVW